MGGRATEDLSWEEICIAVLKSYAIIFFSQRPWHGALVLLCTFWYPLQGLIGLGGLLINLAVSLALGLDRTLIRSGVYLFNSLLISLALGFYLRWEIISPTALFVLLPITSLTTLLLSVSLSDILYRSLGTPSISVPFVIVQLLIGLLSVPADSQTMPVAAFEPWEFADLPFEQHLHTFLQTFGAVILVPEIEVGVVLFLAMLVYSRLIGLFAILGFVVGMGILPLLPIDIAYSEASLLAFNYAFCAIAIGGVFFIPSTGSLVLAVVSTAICALVSVVVVRLFQPIGLAPIALPFNLVVLLVIHAMKMRVVADNIHVTPFVPGTPEENFHRFSSMQARFPELGYQTIQCPFSGERVVTQGVNGKITHHHDWSYALDFEVLDRPGGRRAGSSDDLSDFYTFNTPVLAPEHGTVVKVVDHIDDGEPGTSDLANNWGNLVIIQLESGTYVKLCHLRNQSILVQQGSSVKVGDVIGFCGNSGRSPVPHLHLQVQASPQVGAATIPFRLRHYYEKNGQFLKYQTTGVPAEGARIQGAAIEHRLMKCFSDIARREYRFRTRYRGIEDEETVTCSMNETGQYVFRSERGASVTGVIKEHAFYLFDFNGGKGVLHWFALGLSRVPFISDQRACWYDRLHLHSLLRPWARVMFDLTGPYFGYPEVDVIGSVSRTIPDKYAREGDFSLEAKFQFHSPRVCLKSEILPQQTRAYVSPKDWLIAMEVQLEEELVIEQL